MAAIRAITRRLLSTLHANLAAPEGKRGILGMEHAATPQGSILEQYELFKLRYPNHLVMMQVGEFFEFYGDAAERAARILDIAVGRSPSITKHTASTNRVPFTGFPVRSASLHLGKLVKAGETVVVCEQYQEKNRTSFKRRVARIVTPGTISDPDLLESRDANNLLSLAMNESEVAFAWTDITTGQVSLRTVPRLQLQSEIKRINPKEVLDSQGAICHASDFCVRQLPSPNRPFAELFELFYGSEGIQVDISEVEQSAFHLLLAYLESTQLADLPRLSLPARSSQSTFMSLPGAVLSALEIVDQGDRKGLVSRLNITRTGPGQRLFSERICFPSKDIGEINRRYDLVEWFMGMASDDISSGGDVRRQKVRSSFEGMADFARAYQRVRSGRSGQLLRDLKCIIGAVKTADALEAELPFARSKSLHEFAANCDHILCKDGDRVFHTGYNHGLDEMYAKLDTQAQVDELAKEFQKSTGNDLACIVNIRGAFIVEIPRSATPISHPEFHLDSTTATKLRYRHKALDGLLIAHELLKKEIGELEDKLLSEVCAAIDGQEMDRLIVGIAESDVAAAAAELAACNNYCRPAMAEDTRYSVVDGRHPIVEQLRRSSYVRNSLHLLDQCSSSRFALLTGPNMGGKSTFLKQAALMAIMAQSGLFVPASSAQIGIVDAVFCRVGASDNLCSNQSTFMVEMSEAGEILRSATPRSLILMDEVGRGTCWEEGFGLAWAISKYLIETVKARCLFATHYTELADMVSGKGEACLRTDAIVDESDGSIMPLFDIKPGVAEGSYAVAVARAAGIPPVVLQEALEKTAQVRQRINAQCLE